MHECSLCGFQCDCDGEDHGQSQPPDCDHLTGRAQCEDEDWAEGVDGLAMQPPIDNEHLAPGCEPFSDETIAHSAARESCRRK